MTHHSSRLFVLGVLALQAFAGLAFPQTLVFDLDPEPGDQGLREGLADPRTRRAWVQLYLAQAPAFSGWSLELNFDPSQVRFAAGSQLAGTLFPGQEIQVAAPREGLLILGGSDAGQHQVSGDGDLAQLEFEALPGIVTPIRLWANALHLEAPDWSTEVPVDAQARVLVPPAGDPPPELLSLAGDSARDHLLSQRSCPGCDLRRQDLAQLDLGQVDLRQAQLQEANLLKADLHLADLRGANLGWAVLVQADLREAKLQGTQLKDVRLGGAKLLGADFTGAAMDTLGLQGVNLAGAIWVDGRTCGSGSFGRCR